MKHSYVTHANCDREHCPVCHGGLAVCAVCGAGEGELTTDCPGVPVPVEIRAQVYAGQVDYRFGGWIVRSEDSQPHPLTQFSHHEGVIA